MNLPAKSSPSLATDVVAHEVSPATVHTDARGYGRLGWIIVLLGVGGFFLWALFAPLDKGVPMQGNVAKEGNRKTIQHQNGGIVNDILVQDGDTVKTGQLLVRMSDVAPKSQVEVARVQYIAARAAEARLLAERDGTPLVLPAALKQYSADPRTREVFEVQRQLMSARQLAIKNELAAVDENIAGLRAQTRGLEASREAKVQQLGFLKEQVDNMRELAREGYIARARLLEVERTYAQVSGAISEDIGNISRSQRQVLELSLRRVQRQQEYQKEVQSALYDAQKEAEALVGRMLSLDYDLANAEIRSPVDGIVVGLNVFTRGAVLAPGARLMDIVPADDGLVVEGLLPVNLIDRVHTKLPVELIFSAFNANRSPHIDGVVEHVAADRTVDERTGVATYKVRVKVTPAGTRMIAQHRMDVRPGMPVEIFVKTGERTMMNYLLKPVLDRAKMSLSEE